MAEYTRVTFRFVGPDVEPDMITSCLGLAPTSAHEKGEASARHPGRTYSTGFWGLDSSVRRTEPIEQHLRDLLDRLQPKAAALSALSARGCAGDFFCTFTVDRASGRLKLSPSTLARIGTLGASLTIDSYSVGESSAPEPDDREAVTVRRS